MESFSLNIHCRETGSLHQAKTVSYNGMPYTQISQAVICSIFISFGLWDKFKLCLIILSIKNSSSHEVCPENVDFTKTALDSTCSRLAAGDSYGKIYIFDLERKRFSVVGSLGSACSSLTFIPNNRRYLIVGAVDCSLALVDSASHIVKKSVCVHSACVNSISVSSCGSKAVASSTENATVWNLPSFSLAHRLSVKKSVGILKVFFLPTKDLLVSAFRDNSVFLWNPASLECAGSFSCSVIKPSSWLRCVDGSEDGHRIVCGGKANWLSVWNADSCDLLYNITFEDVTCVKQLMFISLHLSNACSDTVVVLANSSQLYILELSTGRKLYAFPDNVRRVKSFHGSCGKLSVITETATIELFDLPFLLKGPRKEILPKTEMKFPLLKGFSGLSLKKLSDSKKHFEDVTQKQLQSLLSSYGEFPAKYRLFIWSQLLQLPRNEEFVLFYKEPSDAVNKRNVQAKFLSMLYTWCPAFKEVDSIPVMIYPFVKLLHKDVQMCFEVILAFISNWCKKWFFYLPFPPFNILCIVENLLLYHDRLLLHHLLLCRIPSEVYGFHLLKNSFLGVFSDDQWLALWDNIFANPPAFLLYVVTAFNINSREVLLQLKCTDEFKIFYSKSRSSVSDVIQIAHSIKSTTPLLYDPSPLIGSFQPLPKGNYPVFHEFSSAQLEFQTLARKNALGEMAYFQFREFEGSRHVANLLELRRLQGLRAELVIQMVEQKHVEYLKELEDKLNRIQELIQGILQNEEETYCTTAASFRPEREEHVRPYDDWCSVAVEEAFTLRQELAGEREEPNR